MSAIEGVKRLIRRPVLIIAIVLWAVGGIVFVAAPKGGFINFINTATKPDYSLGDFITQAAKPTYRLGFLSQAHAMLRVSIPMQIKAHGYNSEQVSNGYNRVGVIYAMQKKYKEAEKAYTTSLEIRTEVFGEGHARTVLLLNNLGFLFEEMKRPVDALQYAERAVKASEREDGTTDLKLARRLLVLADRLRPIWARRDEAIAAYERATTALSHHLGPHHKRTQYSALALIYTLDMDDQNAKARATLKKYFGEVINRSASSLAKTPYQITCYLAKLQIDLSEFTNFVAVARQCLKQVAVDKPDKGVEPILELAADYNMRAHPELTFALLDMVADHAKTTFGAGSKEAIDVILERADYRRIQGETKIAEELYNRAYSLAVERARPNDEIASRALRGLADIFMARKQFGEAETQYKKVIKLSLPTNYQTTSTVIQLARLYSKQKRYNEAIKICAKNLEDVIQKGDPNSFQAHNLREFLAATYEKQRSLDKAVQIRREIIRLRAAEYGDTGKRTVWAKQSLAKMYLRLGHPNDAEKTYLEILKLAEQKSPNPAKEFENVLHNLFSLYATYGPLEKLHMFQNQHLERFLKHHDKPSPTTENDWIVIGDAMDKERSIKIPQGAYRKALLLRVQRLGLGHVDNLAIAKKLFPPSTYGQNIKDAATFYEPYLPALNHTTAPDHPVTVEVTCKLASISEKEPYQLSAAPGAWAMPTKPNEKYLGACLKYAEILAAQNKALLKILIKNLWKNKLYEQTLTASKALLAHQARSPGTPQAKIADTQYDIGILSLQTGRFPDALVSLNLAFTRRHSEGPLSPGTLSHFLWPMPCAYERNGQLALSEEMRKQYATLQTRMQKRRKDIPTDPCDPFNLPQ